MRRSAEGWVIDDAGLRRLALLVSLGGGLFTAGVSYATAQAVAAQKVDREEFLALHFEFRAHVREKDMERAQLMAQLQALLDGQRRLEQRVTEIVCAASPSPACR